MDDLDGHLRQFLLSHNIRLNKELGQHFLRDEEVLDTIMEEAKIGPKDHVVEIGAGVGVLTQRLLEKAGKVTTVELDPRMIPLLKIYVDASSQGDKLEVIHENALQVAMPLEPYKIVANIPYHITSPLIRHVFMESPVPPLSLTLLIQKEVAHKICDTKHCGLLTIIVGLYGTPRVVLDVPPACFVPPPEVDSAVLHIECFAKPLADPETIERVIKLAKLGFSQKRKMLRNSFGSLPHGLELLAKNNIDQTRRPESLSIEEWLRLATTSVS